MNYKDFILWKFDRETSQYLIFCLLIVAFIFLTPKDPFDKREEFATQTLRLIVQAKDFSPDRAVLEKNIREISGRPDARIVGMRERQTSAGETFYEIDIR